MSAAPALAKPDVTGSACRLIVTMNNATLAIDLCHDLVPQLLLLSKAALVKLAGPVQLLN